MTTPRDKQHVYIDDENSAVICDKGVLFLHQRSDGIYDNWLVLAGKRRSSLLVPAGVGGGAGASRGEG